MFCKKGVLRNFAKFTGKHLCQSLFLIKLQQVCNFIKKETLTQEVFSCSIAVLKILSNSLEFTGKRLSESFFGKFADLDMQLFQNSTPRWVFSSEVHEMVFNSFFTEHIEGIAFVTKNLWRETYFS